MASDVNNNLQQVKKQFFPTVTIDFKCNNNFIEFTSNCLNDEQSDKKKN